MQNFAAIRSAVIEKMTFEFAIFGNFPDIPELKLSLPPYVAYDRPDVTLSRGMSCWITVLVKTGGETWESYSWTAFERLVV